MSIKQISVFVENKPGAMMAMTDTLAAHNIDMRALALAEASDFGIVRVIVDDVYTASTVLKDAGFIYNVSSVLGVAIPDEPGGLSKVVGVLTAGGVNVDYMYAFLGGKSSEHAYMIFRVKDVKAATAVLGSKGIVCVQQEDIAQL